MLAYASARQQIARRGNSPPTLLLIIGAHVTAIAVVMSMKMDLPQIIRDRIPDLVMVPLEKQPPPNPEKAERPRTKLSTMDQPEKIVRTASSDAKPVDNSRTPVDTGPIVGPDKPFDPILLPKIIDPVRTGPRLATAPSLLRPPYPASKLESQQEASLRLRLSIDERGRVVAVEPVGPADPAFLNAARKHLIARWRYQPATEDGRAMASTTVITLRFELEA